MGSLTRVLNCGNLPSIVARNWKTTDTFRACLQGEEGYPSKRVTLALARFFFFYRRVYKAASVTRVGGHPICVLGLPWQAG